MEEVQVLGGRCKKKSAELFIDSLQAVDVPPPTTLDAARSIELL